MSNFKNLFSNIKNDERILLSFDSNYLVLNGEIDLRIIRSLIYTILESPQNEFTINDRTGLLQEIIEKSGISPSISKNITITFKKIKDLNYKKYDTIFSLEILREEWEQIFKADKDLIIPNMVYFPASMIKEFIYIYEAEEIRSQPLEQETLLPASIQKIIRRNNINKAKPIENVIILDDHLRQFYIGDTHMWLSSIRQIQSKTDSTITIACGNVLFYKKAIQIFTSNPFPEMNIILLNWDTLNLHAFDTIICHQNSILPLLKFYEQNSDTLADKKIYRFAPNTEFNNLRIAHPWDINHFFKDNLGIEKKIKSIKQLKKQTHKEIYLSDEEIDAAEDWIAKNGYCKGNKLFIVFDESSYSEKTLDFAKTLALIKLILATPENQIILFDYENTGKRNRLESHLTSSEYNRIISVNGLNIRKEMAIMASSGIFSIIGPCTGMMHLANGIYLELLNNKRRNKHQIPSIIVYCGTGIDAKNYHPRYWWQGAMVTCVAATKQNDLILLKELHEIPLDIEEFHSCYLPVSGIEPEHILSLLN